MSKQKAISALSIIVFVVCFFGNGPWVVDGFRHDDWVTLNHFLVAMLIVTVFIGANVTKRSYGVVMTMFSLALALAIIDIGLEYFGSGFLPNPIKAMRGEMHDYYKIVESESEPRDLVINYIVVFGLLCLLMLIKRSRNA